MGIKKGKIILYSSIVAALIGLVILTFGVRHFELVIKIDTGVSVETIMPFWNDNDNCYYFFLPSYSTQDNICFSGTDADYYAEGLRAEEFFINHQVSNLPEDEIKFIRGGLISKRAYTVRILKSANVGTMFLKTETGNLKKIYSDKKHKESVVAVTVDEYGNNGCIDNSFKLSGHGNSTWEYQKKPFEIKSDTAIEVFGIEACEEWVLLANAHDSGEMRNKLAYEFAELLGMELIPQGKYADLYINGDYMGLYYVCQSPKGLFTAKHSNDSAVMFSAEMSERIEDTSYPYQLDSGLYIKETSFKNQDYETIRQAQLKVNQADNIISEFDTLSDEVINEIIDVQSWVDKFLLDELFLNFDAGISSDYFYCFTEGVHDNKIYAGSCWDYDNSMNNTILFHGTTENSEIIYCGTGLRSENRKMFWYGELYNNKVFRTELTKRYTELQSEIVQFLTALIDELAVMLESAIYCDSVRWSKDFLMDEYTEILRTFIGKRVEFLDSIWIKEEKYYCVRIGGHSECDDLFYLKYGESLSDNEYYNISYSEVTFIDKNTKSIFDTKIPIMMDYCLATKENYNLDNEISLWDKVVYNIELVISGITCIILGFAGVFCVCTDIKRNK